MATTGSIADEMDSVPGAMMEDDEPSSTEPSPHHMEPKLEQHDDESPLPQPHPERPASSDIEIHRPAQASRNLAERDSVPKEKVEDSPQARPPSTDRTTSPGGIPSYPNSSSAGYSGRHQQHTEITAMATNNEGTTEDINDELTPPPESPIEDTMSRTPSMPPNAPMDEIVVGTKTHNSPSPTPAIEAEDVTMGDSGDKPPVSQHAKRKRLSGVYADSLADKGPSPATTEELESHRPVRPVKGNSSAGVKGVLLGFWRDSPAETDTEKHGVIGFIDVRDRLRTRILPSTRDGRPMDPRYPIPPGPGGSWVTFDKVAFDAHLVGLNHHVIKEYVKIRAEDSHKGANPEEQAGLDIEAAELATERVRNNPPPDAATAPLIAYGGELPANAVLPNRPETKKRRLAGSFGVPSDSPGPASHLVENIPGTRPTRILLGYWKWSSEPDPRDKHAVFGILGANDMFRVKLTRETRDGRVVIGNFPSGAGALWIHWDEVEFNPHLSRLSRAEVKEYCRIRQRQLDLGESPDDRVANETKAVYEAQQRVTHILSLGIPIRKDEVDLPPLAMKGSAVANGNGYDTASPNSSFLAPKSAEEQHRLPTRGSQHGGTPQRSALPNRRPLPDVEFRAANRPSGPSSGPSPAALERTNSLAHREIARLEAAQARADLRAASREASLGPGAITSASASASTAAAAAAAAAATAAAAGVPAPSNNGPDTGGHFHDHVSRLNKVWEAQEAHRIRAGVEDAIVYGGVKYARKQSGPFQGKLVSQGLIITIDGEDYVEYRVLTKPTFF